MRKLITSSDPKFGRFYIFFQQQCIRFSQTRARVDIKLSLDPIIIKQIFLAKIQI